MTDIGRPPLGVKPRDIWLEERAEELIRALYEYRREPLDSAPRSEWLLELAEITEELLPEEEA